MSPTLFLKNIFRAKVQISQFNTTGFSQDSESPGLETRNSCRAFALGKETTGVLQGTCYQILVQRGEHIKSDIVNANDQKI